MSCVLAKPKLGRLQTAKTPVSLPIEIQSDQSVCCLYERGMDIVFEMF